MPSDAGELTEDVAVALDDDDDDNNDLDGNGEVVLNDNNEDNDSDNDDEVVFGDRMRTTRPSPASTLYSDISKGCVLFGH